MKKNKGFYGGELPEGWTIKKLKEIISQTKLGGNYENAESNTGIPVIKMGNIERGSIDISKTQCLPEGGEFNSDDVLKKGDL